ncbi:hypothetical protein M8J76_007462 [Diaphorina citri]|nr:hypothetical protein M8J76_007462 [Diaphorina citri]
MKTTTKQPPSPPARKREVPGIVRGILKFDMFLTEKLCKMVDKFFPGRYYRKYYKMLEYTCHRLVLDLVLVALLKAYTRRNRPATNQADMFGSVGPDKFSFPSGHVSRAVYITFFFLYLHPVVNFFLRAPLLSWCTSLALSRVLLRRHFILDVLGGFVLGLLEAAFISYIWFEKDTCTYLVTFLSDQRLGDYD